MKKFLCIIISTFLIVASFAGCAVDDSTSLSTTSSETQSVAAESFGSAIMRRDLLSDEEKSVYDGLYDAVLNFGSYKIEKSGSDDYDALADQLLDRYTDILAYYVLLDHPEIFWCSGSMQVSYSYDYNSADLEFMPVLACSQSEAESYSAQVDSVVDGVISMLPNTSNYDNALFVYEWIIDNCTYYDSPFSEEDDNLEASLYNLFVNGMSNCNGYSKGFKYVMDKLEIPSTIAVGECNDGVLHAWNILEFEGEYYHVDATWDDPVIENGNETSGHMYFCVDDDDIYRSRTLIDGFDAPKCTGQKYNYFVYNGICFDSFNDENLNKAISYYINNSQDHIEIKFTNEDAYNQAVEYFGGYNSFYDLLAENGLSDVNSTSYIAYDDLYSVSVFLR